MQIKQLLQIILFLTFVTLTTANAVDYGEAYIVGDSWWYTQQNSTVGKMIVRDELGGTHFIWTKALDREFIDRHAFYNFCEDDSGDISEQLNENGSQANSADRAGYVALDFYRDDETILPACFYHSSSPFRASMAMDFERGWGEFYEVNFAAEGAAMPLGVKGTIDLNNRAHVTATASEHAGGGQFILELVIWHAEPGEDFGVWDISHPITFDRCTGMTQRIQASRTSEKVAVAWHHNIEGVPGPDAWEGSTEHTMNNDLYLYESPDGEEWDFDQTFNITRTIPVDEELEGDYAYGDTLRPYNDVDLIYVDDVIHAVFSTRGMVLDPEGVGSPPVIFYTTDESFIWHWDSESDSLTLVADGWYENGAGVGSMNSNVDRPSIGADAEGNLYCIFRQVSDEDTDENDNCNGEIMLSLSSDNGETWSEAINLTGTAYDEDDEENLVDENYPSLAELVDDDLHVYYQLSPAEGGGLETDILTENLMIYQRIPVEDLPDVAQLEMPRDGFQYHNRDPLDVVDQNSVNLPFNFSIDSIYPNPFNSRATIRFSVSVTENVKLSIYDLAGREVSTLLDMKVEAGEHKAEIDAADLPTGIYAVRLEAGRKLSFSKFVVIK